MYGMYTACKYAIGLPFLNNYWCVNIDTDTGIAISIALSTDGNEVFTGGYLIPNTNINDRTLLICRLRGSDGAIQWSSGIL